MGALFGTLTKLDRASRASLPHIACRCSVLLRRVPSWLSSVCSPDLCVCLLCLRPGRSRPGLVVSLFIPSMLTQFSITSMQVAAVALLVTSLCIVRRSPSRTLDPEIDGLGGQSRWRREREV